MAHEYPIGTLIELVKSPFGTYDGTTSKFGKITEHTTDEGVFTYGVSFDDGAYESHLYPDEFKPKELNHVL